MNIYSEPVLTQRRKSAKDAKNENELSHLIIGAAIEVHTGLGGPGLLESIYEAALAYELQLQGVQIQRQVHVPIVYKGVKIKDPLCLDLLVENKVIIEVKSTREDNPLFESQLLTYLRLTKIKLGLLINFGKANIKDGIDRIVNNL